MTCKSSSNFGAKLVLIVLASSISLAQCRSLADNSGESEAATEAEKRQDPLVALASQFATHQATYLQPQVQYIVHHQESQQWHPEPANQRGANTESAGREVSYVLVKPETSSTQPDTPVEEDCNQRERGEYLEVAAPHPDQAASGQISASRQEYPGEIVYVSQNGDTRQSGNNNQELEGFANIASQTSGVAATILTEIPIRDMPYEVLEKLKRDYGVKVVATRERPGANLVINCDDYTGRGQSICSRQVPASGAQTIGLHTANLVASPVDESSSAHLQRGEPALVGQAAGPYVLEEPRVGTYVTRDGLTRTAGEEAPQAGNQEAVHEAFGARTYVTLEQTEPVQPERPEEASGAPVESGAEEKTESHNSEGESHGDNGFEAQPDAGVDGTANEYDRSVGVATATTSTVVAKSSQ